MLIRKLTLIVHYLGFYSKVCLPQNVVRIAQCRTCINLPTAVGLKNLVSGNNYWHGHIRHDRQTRKLIIVYRSDSKQLVERLLTKNPDTYSDVTRLIHNICEYIVEFAPFYYYKLDTFFTHAYKLDIKGDTGSKKTLLVGYWKYIEASRVQSISRKTLILKSCSPRYAGTTLR